VKEKALPAFAGERVDLLLVERNAERRRHDDLRLAALEERRAVHAQQKTDFAHDKADRFRIAPVDTLAVLQHEFANDVRLSLFELFLDELLDLEPLLGTELAEKLFSELLLQARIAFVAHLLVNDARHRAELGVDERRDALFHRELETL